MHQHIQKSESKHTADSGRDISKSALSETVKGQSTGIPLYLQNSRALLLQRQALEEEEEPLQAKLEISTPDDEYEQEADRVADAVMRMSDTSIQRQSEMEDEEEEESIQTKPQQRSVNRQIESAEKLLQAKPIAHFFNPPVKFLTSALRIGKVAGLQSKKADSYSKDAPPHVSQHLQTLSQHGQPLSSQTKSFFESRFGQDFSQVRVHADSQSAQTAKDIHAKAYTSGHNIVFGPSQYAPDSHEGKRLLAHELTHVIQQKGNHLSDVVSRVSDDMIMRTVDARAAEIESAVTSIDSNLNPINEIGAQVEFVFWTSGGAVTLVSQRRVAMGSGRGTSVSSTDLRRRLTTLLTSFVSTHERYLQLNLTRQRNRWEISSTRAAQPTREPARPPEGRTLPLTVVGYSVDTYGSVVRATSQILQNLGTYRHGTSRDTITMEMDDDRLDVSSLTPSGTRSTEAVSNTLYHANPSFETDIINALLPLTRGLGRREIKIVLAGRHSGAEPYSDWHVEEANVVRPQVHRMDEAEAIVAEYRATHERIIREWREGVQDAAIYAGMLGARELAFWFIGGAVFRVFGALFRGAAPVLFRLLGRRTAASAGYLETLIVRMAPAEKEQLRVLVTRAETHGLEALSQAERGQLRTLMQRLESLVSAALTGPEKRRIRAAMVARFRGAHGAAAEAFAAAGRPYQIHHRIPLEYGHLFPGLDVNAGRNLFGIDTVAHRGVNAVWTRFRTAPSARITSQHVEQVAAIVDRHFGRWYQRPPSPLGLEAQVEAATNAARREVDVLLQAL